MGRIFLKQMSGAKLYNCGVCGTNLTSIRELVSANFTGSTGAAILFDRVVNVVHGSTQHRNFLTGYHYVCNVRCKVCGTKVGWFYEMAVQDTERYKEGKTVLECALIKEEIGPEWEAFIIFEEETEF